MGAVACARNHKRKRKIESDRSEREGKKQRTNEPCTMCQTHIEPEVHPNIDEKKRAKERKSAREHTNEQIKKLKRDRGEKDDVVWTRVKCRRRQLSYTNIL